jgi:hypothetical protein
MYTCGTSRPATVTLLVFLILKVTEDAPSEEIRRGLEIRVAAMAY